MPYQITPEAYLDERPSGWPPTPDRNPSRMTTLNDPATLVVPLLLMLFVPIARWFAGYPLGVLLRPLDRGGVVGQAVFVLNLAWRPKPSTPVAFKHTRRGGRCVTAPGLRSAVPGRAAHPARWNATPPVTDLSSSDGSTGSASGHQLGRVDRLRALACHRRDRGGPPDIGVSTRPGLHRGQIRRLDDT